MKVGIVGWRGMVGSVLMQRMSAEKDFELFDSVFFSTSNAGGEAPEVARGDRDVEGCERPESVGGVRHDRHRAGRRLHERSVSQVARRRDGTVIGSMQPRRFE